MATATTMERQAPQAAGREFTCECGNVLRVSGGGRHRVYFELTAALDDPVMSRECPKCGRELPGKTRP